MPSNRTPTRFYGPAIPDTAEETFYTVPANKIAVIRSLNFYIDGTVDILTITIGALGADTTVVKKNWTSGEDTHSEWLYVTLTEGETLRGKSDDGTITLTVDGDLYDV